MLAEKLGMTRDQLLDQISSLEMTDWIAEMQIRAEEARQAAAARRR